MVEKKVGAGTIALVQGDITQQEVEAIVTAANSGLRGGGGVDGAVHRAAGPRLLEACREVGGCPTGSAVVTDAFELETRGVKKVIHAVGPIYRDPSQSKELAGAYRAGLDLAQAAELSSIAFPSISTGVYGYPLAEAAPVAIQTTKKFLDETGTKLRVLFVLFDAGTYEHFHRALGEID